MAFVSPNGAEWIWLLVVFVLLFGAKKLPELGSSVGKSIKNFKKGMEEAHADDGEASAKTSRSKSTDPQ
jgi:sec-independent protein translocase protein TatA